LNTIEKTAAFIKGTEDLSKIVNDLSEQWPDRITGKSIARLRRTLSRVYEPREKSVKKSDGKSEGSQKKVITWDIDKKNPYRYQRRKYPTITFDPNATHSYDQGPTTLAEALLWKLGRWNDYCRFVDDFNTSPEPEEFEVRLAYESRIVFVAFTRHLKNQKDTPIFDQHALRALWAVSENLQKAKLKDNKRGTTKTIRKDVGEKFSVERYLTNTSGKWEETGPPQGTRLECYEQFKSEIEQVVGRRPDVTAPRLDRLLMPLGKALKDYSSLPSEELTNFKKYCELCGW